MNAKAVPQADVKSRSGRVALLAMAVVGLISVAFAGAAVAAPIAKNGKVNACYRIKGKAKGAMRVVPANKKCRHGERKLAWSVAGPVGPVGSAGTAGSNGSTGATGAQGSTDEAALQAKIAGLTLKLEGLEGTLQGVTGVLQGVTNGDLTGAVGKLSGITGPELTETVGKLTGVSGLQLTETVKQLPVVSSLCTQANGLPTEVNNSLGAALSGLSLGGTIPVLLTLTKPVLTPVTSYTCPS